MRTVPTAALFGACLALGFSTAAQPPARAGVTVEKVEYRGWKNNLRIANGDAELVVTLDVGPRVISYKLKGGPNVFKNYDDMMGRSGEADWKIRGGHRLWTAPEDITRTYALDNAPVTYKEVGPGTVRLTPPPDAKYGIQKEIELTLAPSGSKVTVAHRITNVGDKPTRLSVWCLTVMAPGGFEVIPLPPKRPHPGDVKNARSAADYAPNQRWTVWPFTDFSDPRWHFAPNFVRLSQDDAKGATKLGLWKPEGAVGYLNAGTLFAKRFDAPAGAYPDRGVNYETFTNQDMLEMESLGPLTTLAPGRSVAHTERWELFGGLDGVTSDADVEAKVLPKLK